MKKNVLIITTGGTISMKFLKDKGIIPVDELTDFLKSLPQLNSVAEIDIHSFSNIASPNMTPDRVLQLAKFIDMTIVNYTAIVVTHGTDTLEETAYLLDLLLNTRKPVVLTAAMRSGSDIGLDGPRNIVGAVRVATHSESIDKGVLVVMNDEIHTAHDVVKADTGKLESFESRDYGILGIVDSDNVIYYRKMLFRDNIWTERLELNVDLIKVVTGMDGRYIDCSVDKGAKGLVVEAFGRGNVPESIVLSIENAIRKNVVVVVVSRVHKGRVLPEYGYTGGGRHLQKIGVILGEDLRGPKARLRLMALFGKYNDPEVVKSKFLVNISH